MFHLSAYSELVPTGTGFTDVAAVIDQSITSRNDHLIFTTPYNLLMSYGMGTALDQARLNVPTLNAVARPQLFPFNQAATVPSRPALQDMREYPMPLPINEEIAIEAAHADAGDVQLTFLLWLTQGQLSRNLPRGLARLTVGFTASAAGTAFAWGALANLTFNENLRGGMYAVVGCQVFDAGCLAYRLWFPNGNEQNGRRFFPGGLGLQAIGNVPEEAFSGNMGEWGRFNSFEPPQIQVFNTTTAASAQVGKMDLIYLGERGAF